MTDFQIDSMDFFSLIFDAILDSLGSEIGALGGRSARFRTLLRLTFLRQKVHFTTHRTQSDIPRTAFSPTTQFRNSYRWCMCARNTGQENCQCV